MKRSLLLLSLFVILVSFKNDKPSYRFFNENGKPLKYKKLLKKAVEADVILFGELHNNPIAHWLQLELTRDIYNLKGDAVLGAEMFERDNAKDLLAYVSGDLKKEAFEGKVRFWPNYKTDYKPLIEFAKNHDLPFVACNIPRKYAALVHKKGFEALMDLPEEEKNFIAPLPVPYDKDLPGYAGMLEMMAGMGHVSENLPKAQAIKDATMAWSIVENLKEEVSFIHYNGTYHSNNYEGIVWYLNQYKPGLKIFTIATVEQENVKKLKEENMNLANATLVIHEHMTKTY